MFIFRREVNGIEARLSRLEECTEELKECYQKSEDRGKARSEAIKELKDEQDKKKDVKEKARSYGLALITTVAIVYGTLAAAHII